MTGPGYALLQCSCLDFGNCAASGRSGQSIILVIPAKSVRRCVTVAGPAIVRWIASPATSREYHTMERRNFIRIAGGGAIFAATGESGRMCRCHATRGDGRLEWPGRAENGDVRRWMLAHAILAPHSHNLQSWLVDLSVPDEILLALRPRTPAARDRSVLAPDHDEPRHLPGTAGPGGPRARPARRHHALSRGACSVPSRSTGGRSRVFGWCPMPRSPRIRCLRRSSSAAPTAACTTWRARSPRGLAGHGRRGCRPDALRTSVLSEPIGRARCSSTATSPHEAWRIELHDAAHDHGIATRCCVSGAQRGRPAPRRPVADGPDRGVARPPGPVRPQQGAGPGRFRHHQPDQGLRRQDRIDARLPVDGDRWQRPRSTQVNAGRAYARVQLAATAHGVAMQPLSAGLAGIPRAGRAYAAIRGLLDAPAPGTTVQMWARVGYAPPVEPAPRRGVEAHILKAP